MTDTTVCNLFRNVSPGITICLYPIQELEKILITAAGMRFFISLFCAILRHDY